MERIEVSFGKAVTHLAWIELKKENPQICNNLQKGLVTLLPEALKRISYDELQDFVQIELAEEFGYPLEMDGFRLDSLVKDMNNNINEQVFYAIEVFMEYSEKKPTVEEMRTFQKNYLKYNSNKVDDISSSSSNGSIHTETE